MSIRIKKKSRLYKVIEEPKLIDLILFGYLGQQYTKLLLLDKIIHHSIMGRIRFYISDAQRKFLKQYATYFQVSQKQKEGGWIISERKQNQNNRDVYNLSIPIYFSVKNFGLGNNKDAFCENEKMITIGFSYELEVINKRGVENKKKDSQSPRRRRKFAWKTCFTITNKPKRAIWIYKQNQSYGQLPAYLMDQQPVRKTDVLCLRYPFYSNGRPVMNFQFFPVQYSLIESTQCPLKSLHSWCAISQKSPLNFQIQDILNSHPQHLQTKQIKKSQLQNLYCIELQCIKETKNKVVQLQVLDFHVRIKKKGDSIIGYLKKKGCYQGSKIELTVGDVLDIYIFGP